MRPRTARILRNLLSAGAGVAIAALFASQSGQPRALERWSLGTAYSALLFLAASLALGPLNILRTRPNPVSTHLRRDLGIWAALFSIVHTGAGLFVHMPHRLDYFSVQLANGWRVPRFDPFGLANYAGLAATLVLCLLLALSNDAALARLGLVRWKALQRWNYLAAMLVLAHGIVYQWLERRALPLVVTLALVAGLTALLQLLGYRRRLEQGRAPS